MASYQIEWRGSALKELRKLPKQMIPRIVSAVALLSEVPHPEGVRKLTGSEHTDRIRVGDYRVIYDVIKERLIIEVIRVRHRADAYQ